MNEFNYLSPEEVGKMFRASKSTVRRWVEAGRLPAVRIGRRLLIPTEAVEKLVEQQLSPSDVPESAYVTHSIVRERPPLFDNFERSYSNAEVNKLADVIIATLRAGGWPSDTFEVKREGLKLVILGQKTAPPAIWRYLCAGIERLSAAVPVEQNAEEIKRSKE
jgi:excisionase family DNA binding protein